MMDQELLIHRQIFILLQLWLPLRKTQDLILNPPGDPNHHPRMNGMIMGT